MQHPKISSGTYKHTWKPSGQSVCVSKLLATEYWIRQSVFLNLFSGSPAKRPFRAPNSLVAGGHFCLNVNRKRTRIAIYPCSIFADDFMRMMILSDKWWGAFIFFLGYRKIEMVPFSAIQNGEKKNVIPRGTKLWTLLYSVAWVGHRTDGPTERWFRQEPWPVAPGFMGF